MGSPPKRVVCLVVFATVIVASNAFNFRSLFFNRFLPPALIDTNERLIDGNSDFEISSVAPESTTKEETTTPTTEAIPTSPNVDDSTTDEAVSTTDSTPSKSFDFASYIRNIWKQFFGDAQDAKFSIRNLLFKGRSIIESLLSEKPIDLVTSLMKTAKNVFNRNESTFINIIQTIKNKLNNLPQALVSKESPPSKAGASGDLNDIFRKICESLNKLLQEEPSDFVDTSRRILDRLLQRNVEKTMKKVLAGLLQPDESKTVDGFGHLFRTLYTKTLRSLHRTPPNVIQSALQNVRWIQNVLRNKLQRAPQVYEQYMPRFMGIVTETNKIKLSQLGRALLKTISSLSAKNADENDNNKDGKSEQVVQLPGNVYSAVQQALKERPNEESEDFSSYFSRLYKQIGLSLSEKSQDFINLFVRSCQELSYKIPKVLERHSVRFYNMFKEIYNEVSDKLKAGYSEEFVSLLKKLSTVLNYTLGRRSEGNFKREFVKRWYDKFSNNYNDIHHYYLDQGKGLKDTIEVAEVLSQMQKTDIPDLDEYPDEAFLLFKLLNDKIGSAFTISSIRNQNMFMRIYKYLQQTAGSSFDEYTSELYKIFTVIVDNIDLKENQEDCLKLFAVSCSRLFGKTGDLFWKNSKYLQPFFYKVWKNVLREKETTLVYKKVVRQKGKINNDSQYEVPYVDIESVIAKAFDENLGINKEDYSNIFKNLNEKIGLKFSQSTPNSINLFVRVYMLISRDNQDSFEDHLIELHALHTVVLNKVEKDLVGKEDEYAEVFSKVCQTLFGARAEKFWKNWRYLPKYFQEAWKKVQTEKKYQAVQATLKYLQNNINEPSTSIQPAVNDLIFQKVIPVGPNDNLSEFQNWHNFLVEKLGPVYKKSTGVSTYVFIKLFKSLSDSIGPSVNDHLGEIYALHTYAFIKWRPQILSDVDIYIEAFVKTAQNIFGENFENFTRSNLLQFSGYFYNIWNGILQEKTYKSQYLKVVQAQSEFANTNAIQAESHRFLYQNEYYNQILSELGPRQPMVFDYDILCDMPPELIGTLRYIGAKYFPYNERNFFELSRRMFGNYVNLYDYYPIDFLHYLVEGCSHYYDDPTFLSFWPSIRDFFTEMYSKLSKKIEDVKRRQQNLFARFTKKIKKRLKENSKNIILITKKMFKSIDDKIRNITKPCEVAKTEEPPTRMFHPPPRRQQIRTTKSTTLETSTPSSKPTKPITTKSTSTSTKITIPTTKATSKTTKPMSKTTTPGPVRPTTKKSTPQSTQPTKSIPTTTQPTKTTDNCKGRKCKPGQKCHKGKCVTTPKCKGKKCNPPKGCKGKKCNTPKGCKGKSCKPPGPSPSPVTKLEPPKPKPEPTTPKPSISEPTTPKPNISKPTKPITTKSTSTSTKITIPTTKATPKTTKPMSKTTTPGPVRPTTKKSTPQSTQPTKPITKPTQPTKTTDKCKGLKCKPGQKCHKGKCVSTPKCKGKKCNPPKGCKGKKCNPPKGCKGKNCKPPGPKPSPVTKLEPPKPKPEPTSPKPNISKPTKPNSTKSTTTSTKITIPTTKATPKPTKPMSKTTTPGPVRPTTKKSTPQSTQPTKSIPTTTQPTKTTDKCKGLKCKPGQKCHKGKCVTTPKCKGKKCNPPKGCKGKKCKPPGPKPSPVTKLEPPKPKPEPTSPKPNISKPTKPNSTKSTTTSTKITIPTTKATPKPTKPMSKTTTPGPVRPTTKKSTPQSTQPTKPITKPTQPTKTTDKCKGLKCKPGQKCHKGKCVSTPKCKGKKCNPPKGCKGKKCNPPKGCKGKNCKPPGPKPSPVTKLEPPKPKPEPTSPKPSISKPTKPNSTKSTTTSTEITIPTTKATPKPTKPMSKTTTPGPVRPTTKKSTPQSTQPTKSIPTTTQPTKTTDKCKGLKCKPGQKCHKGKCVTTPKCKGKKCNPPKGCKGKKCNPPKGCKGKKCKPPTGCKGKKCKPPTGCKGKKCKPPGPKPTPVTKPEPPTTVRTVTVPNIVDEADFDAQVKTFFAEKHLYNFTAIHNTIEPKWVSEYNKIFLLVHGLFPGHEGDRHAEVIYKLMKKFIALYGKYIEFKNMRKSFAETFRDYYVNSNLSFEEKDNNFVQKVAALSPQTSISFQPLCSAYKSISNLHTFAQKLPQKFDPVCVNASLSAMDLNLKLLDRESSISNMEKGTDMFLKYYIPCYKKYLYSIESSSSYNWLKEFYEKPDNKFIALYLKSLMRATENPNYQKVYDNEKEYFMFFREVLSKLSNFDESSTDLYFLTLDYFDEYYSKKAALSDIVQTIVQVRKAIASLKQTNSGDGLYLKMQSYYGKLFDPILYWLVIKNPLIGFKQQGSMSAQEQDALFYKKYDRYMWSFVDDRHMKSLMFNKYFDDLASHHEKYDPLWRTLESLSSKYGRDVYYCQNLIPLFDKAHESFGGSMNDRDTFADAFSKTFENLYPRLENAPCFDKGTSYIAGFKSEFSNFYGKKVQSLQQSTIGMLYQVLRKIYDMTFDKFKKLYTFAQETFVDAKFNDDLFKKAYGYTFKTTKRVDEESFIDTYDKMLMNDGSEWYGYKLHKLLKSVEDPDLKRIFVEIMKKLRDQMNNAERILGMLELLPYGSDKFADHFVSTFRKYGAQAGIDVYQEEIFKILKVMYMTIRTKDFNGRILDTYVKVLRCAENVRPVPFYVRKEPPVSNAFDVCKNPNNYDLVEDKAKIDKLNNLINKRPK